MPKKNKMSVVIGKESGLVGGNSVAYPLSLPDGTKYRTDNISITTYRKMKDNYQISACLNAIAFMMQRLDWYVDKDESTPEITSFIEKSIDNIWTQLIRGSIKAVWAGYSPMTKVFDFDNNYITIKKVRELAPETCTIKTDKKGNFNGFYQYKGQQAEEYISHKYAFWYAYQMEDGDLYGRSMLKAAYKPWYYQELIHLFANRYYERFGEPVVKGSAPNETIEDKDGTKRDAMATVQSLGESLKSHSVVTLPSETDEKGKLLYDLEYLESQMRGVDFDTYLKRLDMEMARAIFIPDLMFGSGRVGSYELGREQKATFITGLMGIADDLFGYFQNYIIRQLVDINFGENAKAPKLRYMPFSKVNEDTYAQIVQALVNRGRVFPDIKTLGKKLGLTLEEIEEQRITDEKQEEDVKQEEKVKVPDEDTAKKQMGRIERYLTNVFRNTSNKQTTLNAINDIKLGYRERCNDDYEKLEKIVKNKIKDSYENNESLDEILDKVSQVLGLSSEEKRPKTDNTIKLQIQTVNDEIIENLNKKLDKTAEVQEKLLEESKKEKKVIVSNDLDVNVKNPTTKVEVSNIKDAKADMPPVIVKEDKKEKPDSVKTVKSGGKVVEIIEKYGNKEVRYKVTKTAGGNELRKV